MGYFSFTITTPKNTPKSDKKVTYIKLSVGVIHTLRILIPAGQKGVCHTQILHHKTHIAPTNSSEDFSGDDTAINYKDYHFLGVNDTTLKVLTWNVSTKYSHVVIISFGVLPKWMITPLKMIDNVSETFSRIIGKKYEINWEGEK